MSTPNVLKAVQLKVASLSAANFPNATIPALYFDDAPATDGVGAQVQPTTAGYGVLKHKGSRTKTNSFALDTREDHDIEIWFYYPDDADCLTAVNAVRLGGGTASQRLGLDYGTLPDLAAPFSLLALRPRGDEAGEAGIGKTVVPVFSWVVRYRLELLRSPS